MTVHPSHLRRKIIHVDMDAFYASVEMKDDPSLLGKPVVVGGRPNGRGVVATASYEARAFGIRSAMPAARAARMCPHAVFLRPRFERYKEVAMQVREIFSRYTDDVEPLSLDEAYLDVTENTEGLYATEIARRIRRAIKDELGLTASAGVAPNKMLAKIASELHKPDGLTVITPESVEAFMPSLALSRIPGIGPVATARLKERGFVTCGDVLRLPAEEADERLGRLGPWLRQRAAGIDERAVSMARQRKSIGHESTFFEDVATVAGMREKLVEIVEDLEASMRKRNLAGRTITLRVKFADFRRISRAVTLTEAVGGGGGGVIHRVAVELLEECVRDGDKVRLLGVALSKLAEDADLKPADWTPLFGRESGC